jgi:hypothetical protein
MFGSFNKPAAQSTGFGTFGAPAQPSSMVSLSAMASRTEDGLTAPLFGQPQQQQTAFGAPQQQTSLFGASTRPSNACILDLEMT